MVNYDVLFMNYWDDKRSHKARTVYEGVEKCILFTMLLVQCDYLTHSFNTAYNRLRKIVDVTCIAQATKDFIAAVRHITQQHPKIHHKMMSSPPKRLLKCKVKFTIALHCDT